MRHNTRHGSEDYTLNDFTNWRMALKEQTQFSSSFFMLICLQVSFNDVSSLSCNVQLSAVVVPDNIVLSVLSRCLNFRSEPS